MEGKGYFFTISFLEERSSQARLKLRKRTFVRGREGINAGFLPPKPALFLPYPGALLYDKNTPLKT